MTTGTDPAALLSAARRQRAGLERKAGQAEALKGQISGIDEEIATLTAASVRHAQAAALLTTIGEQAQLTAREKVEGLATRALQVIFGEQYSCALIPGERAGLATLELVIRSRYGSELVETPVLEARGGGMAAVVGYVLRLVVLMLTEDLRNILFLDETFAHVSAEFEPRVAEFLREVSRKAGVQQVLVTHSLVYGEFADAAVRLELGADGVTTAHQAR
jgi:hypothetical protein